MDGGCCPGYDPFTRVHSIDCPVAGAAVGRSSVVLRGGPLDRQVVTVGRGAQMYHTVVDGTQLTYWLEDDPETMSFRGFL